MPIVRWIGRAPDLSLARALAGARIDVDVTQGSGDAPCCVVASAKVPAAPAPSASTGAAWIWLSPKPVSSRDARAAVLAGAYDVIDGFIGEPLPP